MVRSGSSNGLPETGRPNIRGGAVRDRYSGFRDPTTQTVQRRPARDSLYDDVSVLPAPFEPLHGADGLGRRLSHREPDAYADGAVDWNLRQYPGAASRCQW